MTVENGGVSVAVAEACPNLRRSDTPVTTDTTVSAFRHREAIEDPLTSVLREGACRLLA
ncbi:hypothetical protein [Aurantimonas coralicida]|jgi:hypothetical protein|uniref:hypothetical protein n=1 Tax=Aurantimonas coralicida TaxID=182270 RepID=UPI0017B9F891